MGIFPSPPGAAFVESAIHGMKSSIFCPASVFDFMVIGENLSDHLQPGEM